MTREAIKLSKSNLKKKKITIESYEFLSFDSNKIWLGLLSVKFEFYKIKNQITYF